MSDRGGPGPNKTETLKLEMGISTLRTTILRNQVEISESADRVERAKLNIVAAEEAIKETEGKLVELSNMETNDG